MELQYVIVNKKTNKEVFFYAKDNSGAEEYIRNNYKSWEWNYASTGKIRFINKN